MTKPSIDWSCVAKKFKWLTEDIDGGVLHSHKPLKYNEAAEWWRANAAHSAATADARYFASFKAGTRPWGESLVKRPPPEPTSISRTRKGWRTS